MEVRNLESIQILIIEDDVITAQSISLLLKEFGFTVKGIAHNLESAITFLNTEVFDIALVDINLNETKSGIEIGKQINNLYRIPFIFITGNSDTNVIMEAVKANPAAYLLKPVNGSSLYASIQTALQNFSAKQVATPTKKHEADFFFVKIRNKLKRVEWKEVVLLTSADNYTIFTLADKTELNIRCSLAMTLKFQIPEQLQHFFLQVNRSEAVHINYITQIDEDEIITIVKSIAITKAYIKEVKEKLKIMG